MNKLVICETGDRLGKTSLIKGLCNHYDYKNITVRHCDKPPKDLTPEKSLEFQFECFKQEFELVCNTHHMYHRYLYHDNIVIFDRFYLGEYVYATLFRNGNADIIKNKIWDLEEKYLKDLFFVSDVYLILLTADPEFFLKQEDGCSFSKNIEEKTHELKLFQEAYDFSLIKNKKLIKVDNNGEFRGKAEILKEVLEFLK